MKKEKLSKEEKSKNRLIKLYTIIFILLIALLITKHIFNNYVKQPDAYYKQVGSSMPVSATTKDSLMLKELAIVPFRAALKEGNYEAAYEMCSKDYQKSFNVEDLKELYKDVDASTIDLKELKAYSDLCYEAAIVYKLKNDSSNELKEDKYLLYVNKYNSEVIKISPKGYMYSIIDQTFSENGLEVKINRIDVYLENLYLNCEIKNVDWFSKIIVTEVRLGLGENMSKRANVDKTIEKEQSIIVEENIENSNAFMPDNLQIVYTKNEETLDKSVFYFKNVENSTK